MNDYNDQTDDDSDAADRPAAEEDPGRALTVAVNRALALLTEATQAAEKAGPGSAPRIVAAYRHRFHVLMAALAETLADLLDQRPHALAELRDGNNPLGPLHDLARSLPLVLRAQQSVANDKKNHHELQRVLLNGRGAGYDVPTLLIEDYFQETYFARSFRARVAGLGEAIRHAARSRIAAGQNEVRVLHLRCGMLAELDPLLDDPACAGRVAITFVDENTDSLRRTQKVVYRRLTQKTTFIRADPVKLWDGLNRPVGAFDMVSSLSLFDLLPRPTVLGLVKNCSGSLKPGGALLTSGYQSSVPRGERVLAFAMLKAQVNCWDEAAWQPLLAAARFDLAQSHFDWRQPAGLVIHAIKG